MRARNTVSMRARSTDRHRDSLGEDQDVAKKHCINKGEKHRAMLDTETAWERTRM